MNKELRERHSAERRERKHVPGVVMPFLARELMHNLSSGAWKTWCVYFLHSNRNGFSFISNDTACAEAGIHLNTLQTHKAELKRKRWLESCGQRKGGKSNLYRVGIPVPKPVDNFIADLCERLRKEPWWESLGSDQHNYAEDHLDWLIDWRAICALKKAGWKRKRISSRVRDEAAGWLMSVLRIASKNLDDRGLWWLWGTGFDEVVNHLKEAEGTQ